MLKHVPDLKHMISSIDFNEAMPIYPVKNLDNFLYNNSAIPERQPTSSRIK